jgi:hypothetical protein
MAGHVASEGFSGTFVGLNGSVPIAATRPDIIRSLLTVGYPSRKAAIKSVGRWREKLLVALATGYLDHKLGTTRYFRNLEQSEKVGVSFLLGEAFNRAFAPDIYRGVVAITREADGRLALGGSGTPGEWAVEMRRFDEKCTLDNLAERGQIDAALADALGRVVAAAHAGAPPVAPGPWIAALGDYIDEHVAAFGETPNLFPAAEASNFRLPVLILVNVNTLK